TLLPYTTLFRSWRVDGDFHIRDGSPGAASNLAECVGSSNLYYGPKLVANRSQAVPTQLDQAVDDGKFSTAARSDPERQTASVDGGRSCTRNRKQSRDRRVALFTSDR